MESVVKVDSKGRVLLPINIREGLGIKPDTELVLVPGKVGINIMPVSNGCMAKCTILMSNSPGDLSSVMNVLETLNVGVVMSQSRNFIVNGTSEWKFILDTSKTSAELSSLENKLSSLNVVKSVKF